MTKLNEILNKLESLSKELELVGDNIKELESKDIPFNELIESVDYQQCQNDKNNISTKKVELHFELVEALQKQFGSDEITFTSIRGEYAVVEVEVYTKTAETKIRYVDLINDYKLIHTLYNCQHCDDGNYDDDKNKDGYVIANKLVCEDCKESAIQMIIDEEANEIKCDICNGDDATQMGGDKNYCEDCLKEIIEETYVNEIY